MPVAIAVWRLLSCSDKLCHCPQLLTGLLSQSHSKDDKTAHSWSAAIHAKSPSVPNVLSPVKFHSLCWSFWHWLDGYNSSSEVSSKAHAYAIGMKSHQQLVTERSELGHELDLSPLLLWPFAAESFICCWNVPPSQSLGFWLCWNKLWLSIFWFTFVFCFVLFCFCQPVLCFPLMEAFPVMLLFNEEASVSGRYVELN